MLAQAMSSTTVERIISMGRPLGLLLQFLNATAARRENDMLLGDSGCPPYGGIDGAGVEELSNRRGEFGFEHVDVDAGTQPADGIEPVVVALEKDGVCSFMSGSL